MGCCIESTRAFFCDANNHSVRFFKDHDGQDKTLKFLADGVFPAISEFARLGGASDRTMKDIGVAHDAVKLTRDVTGMFNIFRGVIPGMVEGCKLIGALIGGIVTGNDVQFRKPKQGSVNHLASVSIISINRTRVEGPLESVRWTERPKHNEVAVGRTEMLLKLGESAGGMIGAATFAAGFGIARPAANVRKYFDVEFGDTANRLADSFPYIMVGNHIGGVVQNSFELGYQFKAYERAMADLDNDPEQVEKDFIKKVTDATMGLIEKCLELINDVFLFINVAAPAWIKIPLGLGISGLGVVRVWRKTA
jgi:hypothetical protein